MTGHDLPKRPVTMLRNPHLVSFSQGCLFETRDTVYVLLGHGVRKRAELSDMVKIFRAEGD